MQKRLAMLSELSGANCVMCIYCRHERCPAYLSRTGDENHNTMPAAICFSLASSLNHAACRIARWPLHLVLQGPRICRERVGLLPLRNMIAH